MLKQLGCDSLPVCGSIISIRSALLVALMLNLSTYVLVVQYTRQQRDGKSSAIYITSTVVLLAEGIKLSFSSIVIAYRNSEKYSTYAFSYVIYVSCLQNPIQLVKTLFICSLYAAQNNMVFIAVENTDSAVYQVTSQLKIMSTAIMSRVILKRQLSYRQWTAVVLLFSGVAMVQLEQFRESPSRADAAAAAAKPKNQILGLFVTVFICLLSGIAGVSYEKLLKAEGIEFWVCNFQMHLSGFVASAALCLTKDFRDIVELGYFYSYSPAVWLISIMLASGGILASLVIGYLDSITKTFCVGGAVVLSTLGSVLLYGFTVGAHFLLGTSLVLTAAYLYN